MTLKISISLPKENENNINELEPLITDIGDLLVKYGFGNETTPEDFESLSIDELISYIIINSEETNITENLENSILVVPIKD